MNSPAAFALAAASFFCTALFAQESSLPAAAVSPAGPANAPTPVIAPVAPVAPIPPVAAVAPAAPLAPVPVARPAAPLSRAELATASWLAVADSGDYARSWRDAASLLQNSVPQPQWERALQTSRSQLGAVKSRTLKTATYSLTLTGAPDGEYMFIQYETRFEHNALALETLTTMKDRDNTWKVAGYYIR